MPHWTTGLLKTAGKGLALGLAGVAIIIAGTLLQIGVRWVVP